MDSNQLKKIADFILTRTSFRPKIGIICGSGLGGLADTVLNADTIPYSQIDGFPKSTVVGHAGNLVFGILGGKNIVLMQGRFHPYEGYSPQMCTIPIRIMHLIGVKILLLTNAAGGLNPKFNVGHMMIIKDHISLPSMCGLNPLVGPNDDTLGERFVPMSDAYDKELRNLAKKVAKSIGEDDSVHEGVYVNQFGPAFETVTECRLLQGLGADAVGMSTTHEVIVARHMKMKVFAMSLITNKCILDYDSDRNPNHAEVLMVGKEKAIVMQKIITEMILSIDAI